MPFIGLGFHILIALYFAVHAVRSGQNTYWLLILFSFPLLGSVVYFFAIFLPDSRLEQGAKKAIASAAKALDPTKELRDARTAFDDTPTVQNRMRLAAALLNAGQAEEAAATYEACLSGVFASDPEILFSAARANAEAEKFVRAIEQLELIRKVDPKYRAEQVSLLFAQLLSQAGRRPEAKAEFESAIAKFGGFDVKAEFLIWALLSNERELAERLHAEVEHITKRWNRRTRSYHLPTLRRLEAAYEHARQHS